MLNRQTEVDHMSESSAKDKNAFSYILSPVYISRSWW
jgi:hypothetical protein